MKIKQNYQLISYYWSSIKPHSTKTCPKERKLHLSNQNVPYKNRLLSLTPFMDSEGNIRVGGLNDSHYHCYSHI